MENKIGRIKSAGDLKYAATIDEIGKCFKDQEGHYYKQEKNRVLHVADEIVNILDKNAINDGRINWERIYEEIPEEVFEKKLAEVLQTFYE